MSGTEVGFYHLTRQPLETVLPRLLEKALEAKHRILVRCADAEQLKRLDEHLWTYDDRSFLPHGSDCKDLQTILLTTSEDEQANNPNLLIELATPPAAVKFVRFARVLYLFEESDPEALAAARQAWASLKDREGVARAYWQQDERGRWVKKS